MFKKVTLIADLKTLTAACTALTVRNEGDAFTVTLGTAITTQDTVSLRTLSRAVRDCLQIPASLH